MASLLDPQEAEVMKLEETKSDERQNHELTTIDQYGDLTVEVGNFEQDDVAARKFLVCSRTLARASPVIERMLYGALAESKSHQTASQDWIIKLPEDDPATFDLFCWISHGPTRKIPMELTQDQLVRLTLFTHYYDATEALAPWIGRWLSSIPEPAVPGELQLLQILWTCYELGQQRTFETVAHRLVLESAMSEDRAMLQDALGGHLTDIISRADEIRLAMIDSMLGLFRQLTETLVVVDERPRWCRFASYMGPHRCESMILGSVVFCLTRAGLWPIPESQEICKTQSVRSLYQQLVGIVIHDIGQVGRNGEDHSQCNPRGFLLKGLGKVMGEVADPYLEEHTRYLAEQNSRMRYQS